MASCGGLPIQCHVVFATRIVQAPGQVVVGQPIVAAAAFSGGSTSWKAGRQAEMPAPQFRVDVSAHIEWRKLRGIDWQSASPLERNRRGRLPICPTSNPKMLFS